MPVRIYTTDAGTELSDAEAVLLADLVDRHGRAVLLAPSFAVSSTSAVMMRRQLVSRWALTARRLRRGSARFGELLGRRGDFVNPQRHMLFSDRVTRLDDADLQPLSESGHGAHALAQRPKE